MAGAETAGGRLPEGGGEITAIACSWCSQPASRRHPARPVATATAGRYAVHTPADLYLCPACDRQAQAGERELPRGVSGFGVPVRGESW